MSDSTSVNLYKLVCAGLDLRPGRDVVLTERGNFPSDLYVAGGVASERPRAEPRIVDREGLPTALTKDVAVLLLTHVDYLTGYIHDAGSLTRAAHEAGAVVIWDLSHSAGAVPVDLGGWGADLATGCTYKYLCGGPGSPAYIYVAAGLQEQAMSPLRGWFGHARPFAFDSQYEPAEGVRRFLAGTPPVLALAGLESALDLWLEVDMPAARQKSTALTEAFIDLVSARCPAAEVLARPGTPSAAARRSHCVTPPPRRRSRRWPRAAWLATSGPPTRCASASPPCTPGLSTFGTRSTSWSR